MQHYLQTKEEYKDCFMPQTDISTGWSKKDTK